MIVPVYKAEQFLCQCVDSILAQTYSNIEVILIDDGSPDGCSAICDEYAKKDGRVKVVHQTNGGISKARNSGLAVMTGEYVAFVDSDDYIEKDYIEKLVSAIGDADAVVCSYSKFYDNSDKIDRMQIDDFELTGNELIKKAYIERRIGIFSTPWAKLYKNNMNLRFDEKLRVGEDIVYNIDFLKSADRIKGINCFGYHLRMHSSSTTHQIELAYTPLYEHGNTYINDAIIKAKREWSIDESIIDEEVTMGAAWRFFHEACNIFAKNTPYKSMSEKKYAILKIHNDRNMICKIKQNRFSSMRIIGKVSYVCACVDSWRFTYLVFAVVVALRKIVKK